jgi:hypothetical protein
MDQSPTRCEVNLRATCEQVAEIERRLGDVVKSELHIEHGALTAPEASYLIYIPLRLGAAPSPA